MNYELGGLSFPTKQAVIKHASAVLNRAEPDVALKGSDEWFARDLLAYHPEAERKRGVGVVAVVVAVMEGWGTRNFLVFRTDSSVDNWSIKKCVSNLRSRNRAA